MKVAVTSTVLFDVRDQPLEQVARDFRRANELAIGRPLQTVTGQVYTMLAIERLEVIDRDRPTCYECPFCDRISFNPHDVAPPLLRRVPSVPRFVGERCRFSNTNCRS